MEMKWWLDNVIHSLLLISLETTSIGDECMVLREYCQPIKVYFSGFFPLVSTISVFVGGCGLCRPMM